MRSVEDKGCLNNAATNEKSRASRTALGKPTPSKWDDAQKWLVNLSRGEKNQVDPSPRNSNADDRRLIAPVPRKDYSSGDDEEEREKNVINNNNNSPNSVVRPICLRDMGTEMTPIASQEPSRAATPVRGVTPMSRSPSRCPDGAMVCKTGQYVVNLREKGHETGDTKKSSRDGDGSFVVNVSGDKTDDGTTKMNSLEIRATVWEEEERAKYMARFKQEEMNIQAWENHQKRKAEMGNRKVEAKAERMKSRAQENYNSKLASSRRIAEERRANAEAKLQENAMKTSERADYMRRNGHLPYCFSFKLPSFCW